MYIGSMKSTTQTVPFSTTIDIHVKAAVSEFCKKRGLKLRYVVEQALVEQLEDAMDLEAYFQRRNEKTVSLEQVLAGRKSKKH